MYKLIVLLALLMLSVATPSVSYAMIETTTTPAANGQTLKKSAFKKWIKRIDKKEYQQKGLYVGFVALAFVIGGLVTKSTVALILLSLGLVGLIIALVFTIMAI